MNLNIKQISALSLLLVLVVAPILSRNWGLADRFTFNETADSITQSTYLLGVHSGNYVFENVLPPKPWVDNFGWYMEVPGVQEQVIAGLKQNKTKRILIREPASGNRFDLGVYLPQNVMNYVKDNYITTESSLEGIEVWQRKS